MLLPLRRLLHNSYRTLSSAKPNPFQFPIDTLRETQKEETTQECLFPILQRLGVTTEEDRHRFDIRCDDAIRMILFGAINKNIATQYCHYLAQVCREKQNDQESNYYASKCLELSTYLSKYPQEIQEINLDNLMCDVLGTSSTNCSKICDQLLETNRIECLGSTNVGKILDACYKYHLWDLANTVIRHVQTTRVHASQIESFTSGFINTVKYHHNLEDAEMKKSLQKALLQHLFLLIEVCRETNMQMFTRHREDFINSLKAIGFKVTTSPVIKQSAKCFSCNRNLPTYDNKSIQQLNTMIKQLLVQGKETGLYYHVNPRDISKFISFMDNLFTRDRRPLDYVIDGLNVSYKNSQGFDFKTIEVSDNVKKTVKMHKPEFQVQVLVNTIIRSRMLDENKRILVIGRQHMLRWPGLKDFFDKHRIYFFASTDNTEDDLLQLYAATLSSTTTLVTNDYFRDHVSYFDDPSQRNALVSWLYTHQTWISRENLKAIAPTPYVKVPSIDRDAKVIHLPVVDHTMISPTCPPPHLNNKALKWVCCSYSGLDVGSKVSLKKEEFR